MIEEHSLLILTSKHVPTLRYRAHAPKYKPLLHCTESLKCNDIEIFGSLMEDEHNCGILTS